jgi:glycosyltransferase involved in cell wall biosynthesis
VITTDFYGHKIIKNNENGIIIKTGDAAALLSNLKIIINNQDFYDKLANGASNTKLPTIQEEIEALIDFYN